MSANGIFDRTFAEKKNWKLDAGLARAILFVAEHYKPELTIEFGAGKGRYIELLRGADYRCWGYDGIEGIFDLSVGLVNEHDLTDPGFCCPCCDLGLCFETGEHIPVDKTNAFLRNITTSPRRAFMCSWATIGQRGRNHINCRDPLWVANVFGRFGWPLNYEMTFRVREIAGKGWDKKLLVFEK